MTARRWVESVLLAMVGCGAPISNAPFVQEGQFQAVLPSAQRHGPPRNVLLAPNADNPVLAAAKRSAAELEGLLDLPNDVGTVLRTVPADERTDRSRVWRSAELVFTPSPLVSTVEGLARGWVQADLVNPVDGDFEVIIALAAAPEGPFVPVAEGQHDGVSVGSLTWDLAASAEVLALQPPDPLGTLVLALEERAELEDRVGRVVHAQYGVDDTVWREWQTIAQDSLVFQADLAITEDGLAHPSTVGVFHDDAVGGVADGVVVVDDVEVVFTMCWDGVGTVLYQEGEPPVVGIGAPGACPGG